MANVLGELFGDIATAIRSKTGEEGTMKPAEFPNKIKSIGEKVVFALQTVTGFQLDPTFGAYTPGFVYPSEFTLEAGKSYRVNWDGVDYECVSFSFPYSGVTFHAVGNASSMGLPGNGEPFLITHGVDENVSQIFSLDDKDAHTVGFYTTADASSGGSSDELRHVTFMSYDGTVEYGKKAVAVGDDCADPIARGIFDTPTRESTAQYNYTFSGGWATVPNGGKDANALKAVNEDRTVYANYVSAVRYYTITFYDSDGTTVLTTKSVAYGSVPSYTPTKEGYDFGGWNPTPVAVTGPASYSAVWVEKPAFATATWAKIKEVCDAGMHKSTFAIGDKKPVTLTYADGTSETINFTIVDMDVDVRADGTKAPLTLMADNIVKESMPKESTYTNSKYPIYKSTVAVNFLTKIYNAFPTDLRSAITKVCKYELFGKTTCDVFIPDAYNLDGKTTKNEYDIYNRPDRTQYAYFANGGSVVRKKLNSASSDDYWVNSYESKAGSTGSEYYRYYYIDGSALTGSGQRLDEAQHGIVPCFCI